MGWRRGSAGNPGRGLHAFTLIELLVVISIVAILLALALPALRAVRSQADVTTCMSRLRNVAQLTASYAGDYRGMWPTAFDRDTDYVTWTYGSTMYTLTSARPQYFHWWALLDRGGQIDLEAMAESISCPAVWRLWSASSSRGLEVNPQIGPQDSYYYSPSLFTDPALWHPDHPERRQSPSDLERYRAGVSHAAVTHPGSKVTFFEFADHHGEGQILGTPEAAGRARINAAFADGHVERVNPDDAVPALEFQWSMGNNPPLSSIPDDFPFFGTPHGHRGRDFR